VRSRANAVEMLHPHPHGKSHPEKSWIFKAFLRAQDGIRLAPIPEA
jgi:hypothetical protein